MKNFLVILFWIISLVLVSLHIHENPEIIERAKKYLKNEKDLDLGSQTGEILRTPGNSFILEFSNVFPFSEKTSFIIHDDKILNFNKKFLKVYFQNGNLLNNSKIENLQYASKHDPTGKSIIYNTRYIMKSGDRIMVECAIFEKQISIKNNWWENTLRVIIRTYEFREWL